MAINAELSMVIALVESQALPLVTPFVSSELTTINTFLTANLTADEIGGISTGTPKILVAVLNYALNHLAAGTPPAPVTVKPVVIVPAK